MGLQSPPNLLGFIVCALTALTALIAMALSAALCDSAWCLLANPRQPAAAAGLGVAAGVLGMVVSGVAMAWYTVTAFWDVGVARLILVASFGLVSVLSLVAGIVYAYALNLPWGVANLAYYSPLGVAACVWAWFLFLLAAASAFFCFKAGGGGTATS
jgi:hypothetical protein